MEPFQGTPPAVQAVGNPGARFGATPRRREIGSGTSRSRRRTISATPRPDRRLLVARGVVQPSISPIQRQKAYRGGSYLVVGHFDRPFDLRGVGGNALAILSDAHLCVISLLAITATAFHGATARELFEFIAEQQKSGKQISFVWLDIKSPDKCSEGEACSIEALRDLVRETLEPVGIRVLYGFFETEDSEGYESILKTLNQNEAVCLSGFAKDIFELYDTTAQALPVSQRIMDYGHVNIRKNFGDCHERGGKTCSELRVGGRTYRENGHFGKVMAWTSTEGDAHYVQDLLLVAAVDGIIYGNRMHDYKDEARTRAALQDILDFVNANPDTHRMATADDAPW
ncbi:hypothetical protein ETB97_001990 [Aspergillus alliaceus]|uniref:Uncharacterized protein n=1 Tax=Petromyces alliaceus TaxID=209559 RepID=A0A8H6E5E4_PETAA|nr:hypothetical protein ETB97_001990 [Aspergillus burnettii]